MGALGIGEDLVISQERLGELFARDAGVFFEVEPLLKDCRVEDTVARLSSALGVNRLRNDDYTGAFLTQGTYLVVSERIFAVTAIELRGFAWLPEPPVEVRQTLEGYGLSLVELEHPWYAYRMVSG